MSVPNDTDGTARPHRSRGIADEGSTRRFQWGPFVVPLLVGALCAVVVIARITGTPQVTPITQFLAFYPWIGMGFLGAVLAAVLKRRWVTVATATVCAGIVFATSWPAGSAPVDEGSGALVRVVASNVYVGEATQSLVDELLSDPVPADIVLIAECTQACAEVLGKPQALSLFPFRHIDAQPGARGAAILSRTPLTELSPLDRPVLRDGALAMPSARTQLQGREVVIKVAHPFPPIPLELSQWRFGLDELAAFAEEASGPLIMGGDFNATTYHAPFRSILAQDLSASLSATVGTWPSGLPEMAASPIDNILFRAPFQLSSSGTWQIDGSDHRAVWANFSLAVP